MNFGAVAPEQFTCPLTVGAGHGAILRERPAENISLEPSDAFACEIAGDERVGESLVVFQTCRSPMRRYAALE